MATMLPLSMTTSPEGELTQDVQVGQALPMTRKRYMEMLQQRAALENQQPDLSAYQEYAKSRASEGETDLLNALAAQYAGKRFAPFQAHFLKRAAEAQQPMKLGRGMLTSSGQFIDDPFARQEQQVARVGREIGGLERLMSQEEQNAARIQAQKDAAQARADAIRDAAQVRADALKDAAGAKRNEPEVQQGPVMALNDGTVVQTMYDKRAGQYLYNSPTGRVPVPFDARPATPSTGGPLSASQFNQLLESQSSDQAALSKLDRYMTTIGDTNVGFRRLADQITANVRTAFGGNLTPKELSSQVAKGQLQGLLGLFRTDVVGPGAMTEYDAQRVLQALGGDFNMLQNPQVVERLLREMYESKRRTVDLRQRKIDYNSRFFPGVAPPAAAPSGGGRWEVVK